LAEQVHHSGEGGSSGGLAGLGGGVGRRSGTGVPLKAPASCQPALPGTTPLLRPLQSKKIKSTFSLKHEKQAIIMETSTIYVLCNESDSDAKNFKKSSSKVMCQKI
jgi:hypothetical protein